MKLALKDLQRLKTGLLFLLPNILGFAAFTIVPLILSFMLAFTDWDVQRHNIFKDTELKFVGFDNFVRLFSHPQFWLYLRNTLFLMLGIPFSIAGSLIAALLLTRNLQGKAAVTRGRLLAAAGLTVSVLLLLLLGARLPGVWFLLVLLAASILVGGILGGATVYRTIFYAPHFTAGVATFLLWKKMYHAQTGPVNNALTPVLDVAAGVVNRTPASFGMVLYIAGLLGVGLIVRAHLRRLARSWIEADLGLTGLILSSIAILLPAYFAARWAPWYLGGSILAVFALGAAVFYLAGLSRAERLMPARADRGLGEYFLLSLGLMTVEFILLGGGVVCFQLPEMAADGLNPPDWLSDYHWAKPAIMIMAFWAAVGSNNMILYIAGLTNIPQELYEAADIDGASRAQRFWYVTWPQLAPVTFFIVIMSIIHGLQGGFEMARTMTEGGPAGATTTLSYFVFIEGFETGRLGYASAVVWVLFLMVFVITVFNFKFGNRYVGD